MITDLTDRYHTSEYQRAGTDWTVDREDEPVRALVLHHTAGFYGPFPLEGATEQQELDQLDALAADHMARFGIGPGYHYAVFPSGRAYAIGKYGTHRAHTRGKNPETNNWWNREALAVVAFGDFETNEPTEAMQRSLDRVLHEMSMLIGDDVPNPMIHPHGEVPGNPTATSCPGRHLLAWLNDDEPDHPHEFTREAIRIQLKRAREALDRADEFLEMLPL